jgi:hypothetical protein
VPDAAKHGLQHGQRLPKFGTMMVDWQEGIVL